MPRIDLRFVVCEGRPLRARDGRLVESDRIRVFIIDSSWGVGSASFRLARGRGPAMAVVDGRARVVSIGRPLGAVGRTGGGSPRRARSAASSAHAARSAGPTRGERANEDQGTPVMARLTLWPASAVVSAGSAPGPDRARDAGESRV